MKKRMLAGGMSAVMLCAAVSGLPAMPAVTASAALAGDVTGDGAVNADDVKALVQILLGKKAASAAADIDGNRKINAADLSLLKRKLLGGSSASESGAALKINEVCSTNKKSIKAADGTSPDWIEIYNAGDSAADLTGVGLSDGSQNRYKLTFPAGTKLAAGDYLVIFCDDTERTEGGLHAPFKISAKGETIYLTDADGNDIDTLALPELATDETYGRLPDGADELAILKATPGKSNNAADVVYRVEKPVFSAEGGFYDSAFSLELSDEAGSTILYTLDGSDPRTSSSAKNYAGALSIRDNTNDENKLSAITDISLRGYAAPDYKVDKGMTVRAVCKDKDGNFSAVATNNYFVGKTKSYYKDMKVLSISTDSANFFDRKTGIYVIGDQYEQWKNSGSFDPNLDVGSCDNPTNYNSEGKEWERPCNIQVFEQGKLKFTEDVGVRISGNWTTAFPQKSLTFYARREYGANKMQYDFFEGAATDIDGERIKEYKKVTLRNGGNGYDNARFRDDLNQELAADLQMGKQAKYDYIVFLDGEFWGYYSMQEKLDENYVESHYHVDASNVTTVKNGDLSEGDQKIYQDYTNFWNWAMSANMSDASNYKRVCDTIDVQGFMEFIAFENFLINWDCLINPNNWMIWRANETDSRNAYADGKWRFLLFDTEYSSGYDGQCALSRDCFRLMDKSGKMKSISSLFFKLMDNKEFKEQFFKVYERIMGEVFDETKVSAAIDRYAEKLKAAVDDTFKRFGVGADFSSNVRIVRNFFKKRPAYAKHYLNVLYGISDNWQPDPNLIDQFGWSIWMNTGAGSISYEEDGSITVNVTRTGQYAQVSSGSVEMKAGKTYKMTYTISVSQPVTTYTMFQEGTNDYTSYGYQDHNFSQQPQTFTDTVTMTQDDDNVKFLIGLDKGTGVYKISDFSMICVN